MPRGPGRARLRTVVSHVRATTRRRARSLVMAVNPSAFSRRADSPADFQAWVARGMGRHTKPFPDSWKPALDRRVDTAAQLAVLLHVYYAELLDEILEHLAAIPVTFDLIVTNASGRPLDIDRTQLPRLASLVVLDVENRGRDILPLAQVVNAGLLNPYSLVLKVHTKRSDWRASHGELAGNGEEWRRELLNSLLGNTTNVSEILSAFATSSRLGLVTADGSVLGREYWGRNQTVTAALLRRLELDLRPRDLKFAAGSMYWVRGFVLQGLRALDLSAQDFEPETGQVNATTAHAVERLIGALTAEAGYALVERSAVPPASPGGTAWQRYEVGPGLGSSMRVVPFYLPQFHVIPENDHWWGPGFTEWTNVTAALPVYLGHDQPKLPAGGELYDLTDPETVARQALLAEAAWIGGFMYYHYWFAGKPLLERPIRDRLAGDVPLPFCLMWANENWTRRWDGRESDVLIGQDYDRVPASKFIEDVIPILCDPRYMRIEGRPLVAVYRPGQIPDLPAVIESWRDAARRSGLGELYVAMVDVARQFHGIDKGPRSVGLDGTIGFPPHNALWQWVADTPAGTPRDFSGRILSYRAMANDAIRRLEAGPAEEYFPGVMVNFDNTARRQSDPDIWYGSNPYTFRRWLDAAATAVSRRKPDHRLVFVNAWNEWAEGATLEPSERYGSTYLLAVRDVTRR
jgi:lipopolysaccharide biosynthesis protein